MIGNSIKINSLTYSIFTLLFSLYFAYLNNYLISAVFLIYAILFVSIYVISLKSTEFLAIRIKENYKHYLLNLGFMLCWLVIFIVDLKSIYSAYSFLQYLLAMSTFIVISTLYFKVIIKK